MINNFNLKFLYQMPIFGKMSIHSVLAAAFSHLSGLPVYLAHVYKIVRPGNFRREFLYISNWPVGWEMMY